MKRNYGLGGALYNNTDRSFVKMIVMHILCIRIEV